MVRRIALLGAVSALVLPTASPVLAQPTVRTVRGTVQTADGSPAADVVVTLAVNPESGLTPLGLIDTPTAFGAGCSGAAGARCGRTVVTRTGRTGQFEAELELPGDDLDDLDDLAVVADLGDGRLAALRTRLAFAVRRPLPTLREWAAGVRPIPATGGETPPEQDLLKVLWFPLPRTSGRGANYTLLFSDQAGEVWTFPDKAPGFVVDPRLLEDMEGQARVDVEAFEVFGDDQVDFFFRSSAVRHSGSRGAPPSRGGRCRPASEQCRLADGRAVPHTSVPTTVLELPTPIEVSLVTARGCPTPCQLELSADGVVWSTVGREFVPLAAITVDPPIRARFARATFVGTEDLLRAPAELSVWGVAQPATRPDPTSTSTSTSTSASRDVLRRGRNALPVLVLAGLVVLLVLRSRRRRDVTRGA